MSLARGFFGRIESVRSWRGVAINLGSLAGFPLHPLEESQHSFYECSGARPPKEGCVAQFVFWLMSLVPADSFGDLDLSLSTLIHSLSLPL